MGEVAEVPKSAAAPPVPWMCFLPGMPMGLDHFLTGIRESSRAVLSVSS